jgi:hypothetical protein
MLPGPGENGHDVALATMASQYDRQFHLVNAATTGVTADVTVPSDDATLADLTAVIRDGQGAFDVHRVTSWGKTAGLYAGAGIAADAFRYATLRDQGASCADIETARADLLKGLLALHLASELPATPGVIARGFIRKDYPGAESIVPMPLFDGAGNPLPTVKNNGTFREDRSGKHPEYLWEDSCSRDMYLGWALALGIGMEVVKDDSTFPADLKALLRADATAMAHSLMTVQASGYDLEIRDADGRTTLNGLMNENSADTAYVPGVDNGFNAVMSLGIVGALAFAAQDPAVTAYLRDKLISERGLPGMASNQPLIFSGHQTNGSNINMLFTGMWAALHFVDQKEARATLAAALRDSLYSPPVTIWRPADLKQTLFDFIQAGESGDPTALSNGMETLHAFPTPPYRGLTRHNCDDAEIQVGQCTLEDGTSVHIGLDGRGTTLVADRPLPMKIRPPSNYYWRSDPYTVNGDGDPGSLYSGVDFRFSYWLGRWTRVH